MDTRRIRARVDTLLGRVRARSRLLDHLARALAHYSSVLGSQLAAAATYFGFLSFFPLVALAFAVLGYVVAYVPDAEHAATTALSSIFPGMIGTGPGKIDVHAIARRKADVGILGLLVLLYSGLGWVSALRVALQAVFEVVSEKKRNFFVGKVFDLIVLAVVGVVLISSVGLGAAVTGFTSTVVRLLGL
ncbi:MAG TPA: YhjD/YihY/BrkB family envelope integrity protein, partial [Actinopolymorphaceae bacterium]|nr:YhjD/YihY/BrkB family envelope integrity protein [Actinopolymorphaceae bacterium]